MTPEQVAELIAQSQQAGGSSEWMVGFAAAVMVGIVALGKIVPWATTLIRGRGTPDQDPTAKTLESLCAQVQELGAAVQSSQASILALSAAASERSPDGLHPDRCRYDSGSMKELVKTMRETNSSLVELKHSVELLSTRFNDWTHMEASTTRK